MIFKNAMKWLKEKFSGKKEKDNSAILPDIVLSGEMPRSMKTEPLLDLSHIIAPQKTDEEIEAMKSTIMTPIVVSQIGRAQWLEKEAEQIAEITQNTTEEVREEILKISTETAATTEEAVERVRERKLEDATAQIDSCKRQIIMSNNERRRKGIPMVRWQQLRRAERNQRRRRSENRKKS